jgi:hypothetical protein
MSLNINGYPDDGGRNFLRNIGKHVKLEGITSQKNILHIELLESPESHQ